jgi:invasion protein IalB
MADVAAAYRLAKCFLCILIVVVLPAVFRASDEADASELIYSQWEKLCFADMCLIGSGIRSATKCNPVVAAATLTERTGESKKTLRVGVPKDVRLEDGVRISIDGEQSMSRPFAKCFPIGCAADVEAGVELVDRLKNGTMLVIEATSAAGAPLIYKLRLPGLPPPTMDLRSNRKFSWSSRGNCKKNCKKNCRRAPRENNAPKKRKKSSARKSRNSGSCSVLARKTAESVEGHVQRIVRDRDGERYLKHQESDAVFVPRLTRRGADVDGVHGIISCPI